MASKTKLVIRAFLLTFFDLNGLVISTVSGLAALITLNMELYAEMMFEDHQTKDVKASEHLQRIGFYYCKIFKISQFPSNKTEKKILRYL